MKASIILLTVGMILTFTSCSKEQELSYVNGITASAEILAVGQHLTASFGFEDHSQGIQAVYGKWSVAPSNVLIGPLYTAPGKETTITFSQPGTYTIQAEIKRTPCPGASTDQNQLDQCFPQGTSLTTYSKTIVVQ